MALISWFILYLGVAIILLILIRIFKEEFFLPAFLWVAIVFILVLLLHMMVQVYFGNLSLGDYMQAWIDTLIQFDRSEAFRAVKKMVSNVTSSIS